MEDLILQICIFRLENLDCLIQTLNFVCFSLISGIFSKNRENLCALETWREEEEEADFVISKVQKGQQGKIAHLTFLLERFKLL